MRLWSLGSGSKGNAVLIESGDSRLLIDAGFAPRTLAQRLQTIGIAPGSISDCIITHEHGDHCRGAAAAATRWGWRLHATAGTIAGCPGLPAERLSTFVAGDTLSVAGMTVQTLASPHDANEPTVLVATSRAGVRAGVAYDLGHMPETIAIALQELDLLVLESNHDEGMLRAGPYPASVQARIASIVKSRYGYRAHHRGGAAGDAGAETAETQRLREEVRQLKERLAVLERITVEKESSLEREIERLRHS